MSGRFWATAVFCCTFALLHCGGSVDVTLGSGGGAGLPGHAHAGHSGRAGSAGSAGAGALADAGFDVYVDPGCPDVGPPVQVNHCDAFSPTPNCPAGYGCFPFVEHPIEGCGAQRFGTECQPAGVGRQGDSCAGGDGDCATGFVCVVGSQPGKHCVQLCPVGSQNTCPAGLICGELDVESYGVCS
jgi:hypothetical protein